MKHVSFLLIFLMFGFGIYAQEQTQRLDAHKIKWVKIKSKSKITVVGYDKDEIQIKIDAYNLPPEKAKGLKQYGYKQANTDVGFYMTKDGETMYLESIRNVGKGEATIFVPKNMSLVIDELGMYDISVENVEGEIEVSSSLAGAVSIHGVSGPLTINTSTGDVTVDFKSLKQSTPLSISSLAGEVEVKLPVKTKADVKVTSSMGELYTNFDLEVENEKDVKVGMAGIALKGKINKGGVLINLHSGTGNIYLRKK
ncbi:DUF4097 family beta strand repeat-containing protein [Neptunitalea lumnitzerae]|nr:DUF4097 family beta strand repeat-containing protein [Neptunitalea sp. Y10]